MTECNPGTVTPGRGRPAPRAVVVMGVAGCGKTEVGRRLAERLGFVFRDGDDYHPPANVAKMSAGQPLDDHDRRPWLERLARLIDDALAGGPPIVLACSALKQHYRDLLGVDRPGVRLVHLTGSFELIRQRLADRTDHFFSAELLRSQFAALEPPRQAVQIDVTAPPDDLADRIVAGLGHG